MCTSVNYILEYDIIYECMLLLIPRTTVFVQSIIHVRDPETIWATPRPTCSPFRYSRSVKKTTKIINIHVLNQSPFVKCPVRIDVCVCVCVSCICNERTRLNVFLQRLIGPMPPEAGDDSPPHCRKTGNDPHTVLTYPSSVDTF